MNHVLTLLFLLLLPLPVYGQTFRIPLPEFLGEYKAPFSAPRVQKKIGAFSNVANVRVEIAGTASPSEEATKKEPGKTVTYLPSVSFMLHPECVPSYDPLPLEPYSTSILEQGSFRVSKVFIKKKTATSFLSRGDGRFTLSMHIDDSAPTSYGREVDRLRSAVVTVTEATLIVEADKRIGDEVPWKSDPFRLPVLFSNGYTNHARGYQDNGFLVDADGKVFMYDNRCRGRLFLNGDEPLTDEIMQNKFTMTKFVKKIGSKELKRMKRLIPSAAKGNISRQHRAYDAGMSHIAAYIYNKSAKTYTEVELGADGDYTVTNDSPTAAVLNKWLNKLHDEIYPPPQDPPSERAVNFVKKPLPGRWNLIDEMPSEELTAPGKGEKDPIFFLLEEDSDGPFLIYSPKNKSWHQTASVPDEKAMLYKKPILLGDDFLYSFDAHSTGGPCIWRYSISQKSWKKVAGSPLRDEDVYGGASAVGTGSGTNGFIYVLSSEDNFWRYSLRKNSWEKMENAPPFPSVMTSAPGGDIYGIDLETSTLWRYSVRERSLSELKKAPLDFQDYSADVITTNGRDFFAVRGKIYDYSTERWSATRDFLKYSISQNEWSKLEQLPEQTATIAVSSGGLYALAGDGGLYYFLFK